jgi:hypothetical protein
VSIWEEGLGRLEHCGTCYTDLGGVGYFVFFFPSWFDTPAFAIHGNREDIYAYTATSGLFSHLSSSLFFFSLLAT